MADVEEEPQEAEAGEAEAGGEAQEDAEEAPAFSEVWSVVAKHSGCYSGGKVAWAQGSKLLCCLSSDELNLVDVATQLPTRTVAQEGDGVLTYGVDPSGQNVVTSHRSGLLRHFKLGEKTTLERSWRGHEELVVDVSFDTTGDFVASGSADHTAKVWDFAGYFCTHNFRCAEDQIVSMVRFHPAKLQLLTVSGPELRLWDLKTSSMLGIMKDHLSAVSSVGWVKVDATTHRLVTGGRDQVLNVWNLGEKSGEKIKVARTVPVFETLEGVVAVPLSGLREACSSSGPQETKFHRWVRTTAKLPEYVVFTVGDKAKLRAWNPNDGKCIAEEASPHGAKGLFRQILFTGEKLLTVGDDLNVIIWSLPQLRVESYVMGQNDDIVHVQFIPSSNPVPDRFICITNDEHPRIVNCEGFGAQMLRGHTDMVIACDVSADGQWIATGGKDQTLRVWSTETTQCVARLSGHAGPVSAVSFPKKLPKNKRHGADLTFNLVSVSQDKIMKVWEIPAPNKLKANAESGSEPFYIEKAKTVVVAHTKEVNDVVVSPNNKLMATGGQDKLVRFWKFPQADLLGEGTGHGRGVWCVAFSPVDQVLASASGDATVRLWNLKDYKPIRSFQGHTGAVLRVCFLQNGMQLMTSGSDGLLKLWQIRTADCAATYEEHEGKVWCIDMAGQHMVSGGADSKLCVWRDTTKESAKEKRDAAAEAVMKDTRIGLLVREGKLEAALTLSLDLNRPGQMQQILGDYAMAAVERSITQELEGGSDGAALGGVAVKGANGGAPDEAKQADAEKAPEEKEEDAVNIDLQRWVLSLSGSQLERLIEILEQWNSNRKMASVAQMLMSLVLVTLPPAQLGALEGMNATCMNVLSYSGRHIARVDALLQKTFLLDLVLQSGAFGLALDGPGSVAGMVEKNGNKVAGALQHTMDVLLGEQEEPEEEKKGNDDDDNDEDDDDDEAAEVPQEPVPAEETHTKKKRKGGQQSAERVEAENADRGEAENKAPKASPNGSKSKKRKTR